MHDWLNVLAAVKSRVDAGHPGFDMRTEPIL